VNIYEIGPDEVSRLDQLAFVDAVNHLVRAEASRSGIPTSGIHTNLRVNESDAGIDARVLAPSSHRSQWIPLGTSAWQMKSGNVYPGELRKEFNKPGVQKVVKHGGTYCVAIGVDYGDKLLQRREEVLQQCFHKLGLDPRYRLYTASDLAAWGSEMLGIVLLPHFNHPVGELTRWEKWSQDPKHALSFEADHQREQIVQEIRRVEAGGTDLIHIRLEGQSGVGKTRLALEAFRGTDISERVSYASSPDDVYLPLFSWLEANPTHDLILVVDECDKGTADRLHGKALRCRGRILLVTIGPGRPPEYTRSLPEGVFVLEKMGEAQIKSIVTDISSALHPQAIDFIARASSGFVKLATALARAILKDPSLVSAADLARAYDVDYLLNTLIPGNVSRKVMKALALLSHVGWEREVALEGQVVTEFIGVPWSEAQDVASDMMRQGYIAKQGRYRYVTPHLLAVWLALEVWEARGEEVLGVAPKLPTPASRRALLERLADLGEAEVAYRVVEALLSEDGLFPDVNALDDEARADVFGTLCESAPQVGLRALERLLSHLPRDRLLTFQRGRRSTVWALERLAWHPETFFGAARVLLKLAEAENEPYANNATGIWASLFQTHLGGTAVSALERHQLLREALESDSSELRMLGLLGIQSALSTREIRDGEGEHQRGRIVPSEWRPRTLEEEYKVRRSALDLLDTSLADADSEVVAKAREILIQSSRGLILRGLADDVLARLKALPLRDEAEQHQMWELLQQILTWEGNALSVEQRKQIEQWAGTLMGESFHDRLRRWAGQVSTLDYKKLMDHGRRPEDIAVELAEEGFRQPDLLHQELDWLNSSDAKYFHVFGRQLGELDSEHTWLPELAARARTGNAGLLSAYLRGRADAGDKEWVQRLLDEWAESNQDMAFATFDATWRNEPGEHAALRLVHLVDKGWISPVQLGQLPLGGWPKALPPDIFRQLLGRLVQDDSPAATEGGLTMLLQWLDGHPGQHAQVSQQAWALLERSFALSEQGMVSFCWENVAERYVSEAPRRIARAVLRIYEETDTVRLASDARLKVLRKALFADPKAVWPEIGEFLLRGDEPALRLRLSLEDWGIEAAGSTNLLEWAAHHKPRGPRILARLATPMLALARGLLIHFGDDEVVGSSLAAKFLSGFWQGSQSAWLEGKLARAQGWVEDDHSAVRKWAGELVADLEQDIKRARQTEEEEYLR
jgi:hypothetical protein